MFLIGCIVNGLGNIEGCVWVMWLDNVVILIGYMKKRINFMGKKLRKY